MRTKALPSLPDEPTTTELIEFSQKVIEAMFAGTISTAEGVRLSQQATKKLRALEKQLRAGTPQSFARLGGIARAKSLSDAELSKIGKKGARERMKQLSASERSEIAKKAVEARIKKYGQKRRTEE